MGNAHGDTTTLLDLCRELENLPPNVYQNNNKKIEELHEKIFRKLSQYRTNWKMYSDDDLLEYETVITLTERENVFYKRDSSGITEIQYALNSYLKAKYKHNIQLILELLSCFPSPNTRLIARFCVDNGINYQNFIMYDKHKSIKDLDKTQVYIMYPKLRQIALVNKFDLILIFNPDRASFEITITNKSNNKKIKFVENITPYTEQYGFFIDNVYHAKFELGLIAQTLN